MVKKFNKTFFSKCNSNTECVAQKVNLNRGIYRFELWGAQGGSGLKDGKNPADGGKGAYVAGDLTIKKRTTFFLYIGSVGADGKPDEDSMAKGGCNGGGNAGSDNDNDGAGGGGGATDIRTIHGAWNNSDSLYSRIIVASGGSGAVYGSTGAPGGSLYGFIKSDYEIDKIIQSKTSQTDGYLLGTGEAGKSSIAVPSTGSGSGYQGGYASPPKSNAQFYTAVSSSGSSFISGYPGCDSVDENGQNTGLPNHFSQHIFQNGIMLSGNLEMPSPYYGYEKGHSGSGAIRISQYLESPLTCKFESNSQLSLFLILVYIL